LWVIGGLALLIVWAVLANRAAAQPGPLAQLPSGNSKLANDAVRLTPDEIVRQHGRPRELFSGDPGAQPYPSQTVVDVMVLYTGDAKAELGEAVIDARIALGIALLNEACNRSSVPARFRLVHKEEATWHTESPNGSDELSWLSEDATVADLRDKYGADLVSLLARQVKPTGGIAQVEGVFSVFDGSPCVFAHCQRSLKLTHPGSK
jgi:hypothetical protein